MKLKLSSGLIKQMAAAHSVVGLALCALLYVVCLSGSLAVFFEEFERWEQPLVPEFRDYSPRQIDRAVTAFLDRVETRPEKLFIVLPRDDMPRMHLSGDGQEWYVNPDGSLGEPPAEGWTLMLLHLHNHLLLPETLGLIITGSLGAMLCGLIITGLLSHPRLVKDLFRLRLNRQERLRQADIHNRLSVWGLPFYLMFGLTGAFFGLVGSWV